MRRPSFKVAILFALVFVFGQAIGGPVAKRDADKSMMDTVKDMADSIPLVGTYMKEVVQMIQDGWNKAQELTNGGIGRVAGGAFPCTIYLEKGVKCTGVSAKSDMSDLVATMLEPIPGLVLPEFMKTIIVSCIDMFLVPAVDMMLGGVHKSESKS